jgi:SAM-dependent methyltransferase
MPACRICGSATVPAGARHSTFSGRHFELGRCPTCRFGFVVAPRTDFENIYDEAYYAGRGADPHISYAPSANGRPTVQRYEWRGVVRILRDAGALGATSRWLDYGCGLGGLVRFARASGYQVWGYDEGYAADRLHELEVPSLTAEQLDASAGTFDVVTAIEVLEHVVEPLAILERIRHALRPGGLLFLTTGNARPYRNRLDRWQYVRPDIHVSLFEPSTLRWAYGRTGLQPTDLPYGPGYTDIIRSKVLRTLDVHSPNAAENLVPWSVVARLVDRRFGVSEQPAGRRPVE